MDESPIDQDEVAIDLSRSLLVWGNRSSSKKKQINRLADRIHLQCLPFLFHHLLSFLLSFFFSSMYSYSQSLKMEMRGFL